MYTFRAMNIARDLVIGMEVFTCLAQHQWNEHKEYWKINTLRQW